MGFDIGIRMNKKIESVYLKEKFHPWVEEDFDFGCLSRGYCSLMLLQFESGNEELFIDLKNVFGYDCTFLQRPKVNHVEEGEDTLFQFGWEESKGFLAQLKELKLIIDSKQGFIKPPHWPLEWEEYFITDGSFLKDIANLVEVLEVGNAEGVTEVCYVIG